MKKSFYVSLLLMATFNLSCAQEYDVIIKNGRIIDAKNKIDRVCDLGIKDGIIQSVGTSLSENKASVIIDAENLIVTPGLIDIHSHNFHGTTPNRYLSNSFSALAPDGFTFRTGITTIVDVGGAGWRNFEVFKEQVIDKAKTRVLSFLNIVGSGMQGGKFEQDL